jgi:cell division protease FtsH
VRILARRAKRLARKWGGQCIVFIDEIDAVGMRRNVLNPGFGGAEGGMRPPQANDVHDLLFFGPFGALNPSGDLILENRHWRERLFAERAPDRQGASTLVARANGALNFIFPGGMGGGGSLALNQLLVVMDGIDNPPFMRKFFTNKINTLLDGTYIVPRRIRGRSIRIPAARPRKEQIYFIGATNVPVDRLDPALTRPGRMGRHVWFRTPTKQDRLDVLDLYLDKVAHAEELDQPNRREEIARVTNGYSPAMLEQVTSMALTIAHHSGREALLWEDLVEAMTTLEAGTAVGVEYVPEESRAVAIHEAGHAAAGHAYLKGAESTRLSIRMRGGALGHHQALEKEERFSRFRSEEFARLVWALGAMAAERVFYGENSNGVGGDVQSVTLQAAFMVGASAMGPQPFEVTPNEGETEEEARERILKRFEKIGLQIVNRTSGGGPFSENPVSSVLNDQDKRALVGQILGQAYVAAHNLIVANRESVEQIADVLAARRELFGDELLSLLDGAKLTIPDVDLSDESSWPTT